MDDFMSRRAGWRARFDRMVRTLPTGAGLAEPAWQKRHRIVLGILVAHLPFLWWFGVYGGANSHLLGASWPSHGYLQTSTAVGVLAFLTASAAWPGFSRRSRAVLASLALVTSSAILTHFSGGYIEAHFHFFVVLGLIAFYQDWIPFTMAVVYVALHHGVAGMIDPEGVYNHAAGVAFPWLWALVHAFFILGLAAVLVTLTRLEIRAHEQREAAVGALQEETERLHTTLEGSGAVLFTVDSDERWTMLKGRDLHGVAVTADEVVGKRLDDTFAKHPQVARNIRRALAGATFDDDVTIRGRVFHTTYRPRWNPATGRVEGMIGVSVDVTERTRAEKAERLAMLQRSNIEHLKATERFRRQLFNTAAHELNTPLTPIQIQLHMLQSGNLGELNQEQEKALGMLERNITRLGTLVKDVLDVARIQNARLALNTRPVRLDDLVEDAVESFRPAAAMKGIELVARLERGFLVAADERRIMQVIYNLLSNAVKFTPAGGSIVVTTERHDEKAVLTVADTGRGLLAKDIRRLFQPFMQVYEAKQGPQEGSGLGLYIARGIIERHGGRIWVESPGPGRGSTFGFELPLATQAALDAKPEPESTDPKAEGIVTLRTAPASTEVFVK